MATIRERCEPAFHMDATHGDDGLTDREAATFLARYLNGSRLDHGKKSKSLVNACEKCKHREPCHEAFGVSEEGHGLYPFTAKAATNFVRAHSRDNDRFDPRRTVRGLRDHLLRAFEEIPTSDYPSRAVLDQFAEYSAGRARVKESDRGAVGARSGRLVDELEATRARRVYRRRTVSDLEGQVVEAGAALLKKSRDR